MINLKNAKCNKWYFIKEIDEGQSKLRLMEMGFCNCKIKLIKTSFGKIDYLFCLRGFKIILRKDLVQSIWVEEV